MHEWCLGIFSKYECGQTYKYLSMYMCLCNVRFSPSGEMKGVFELNVCSAVYMCYMCSVLVVHRIK